LLARNLDFNTTGGLYITAWSPMILLLCRGLVTFQHGRHNRESFKRHLEILILIYVVRKGDSQNKKSLLCSPFSMLQTSLAL
jgi:hypothetical protein